jgi:hypothetical protein
VLVPTGAAALASELRAKDVNLLAIAASVLIFQVNWLRQLNAIACYSPGLCTQTSLHFAQLRFK